MVAVVVAALLAVLVAPGTASASIDATLTATFSDAVPEQSASASRISYCGGTGQPACTPAQVRWGSINQSTLGFAPRRGPGGTPLVQELDQPFLVGVLEFLNTGISAGTGIESVVLTLTVQISDSEGTQPFTAAVRVPLLVEMTTNDAPNCCADNLHLPAEPVVAEVENEGVTYRVEILGFSASGTASPSRTLVAPENARTAAGLVGVVTRTMAVAADAGVDQVVDEGTPVTLDGTGSQGAGLVLVWQQTAGPTVTLDDPSAARPTFSAPAVGDDATLEFVLTATSSLDAAATATDTVVVTVRDVNRPPALSLPADLVVTATDASGAVVTYEATATDPDGDAITVACTPGSGTTFAVGTTTVECTASDGDDTVTGSFQVLVNAPPELRLPAGVTADATSPAGAPVEFEATATDDGTPVDVACAPATGTTFAIGTTAVECAAVDGHGATTTGTFDVTVRGAGEQLAELLVAVTGVGPGKSLADKVRTALADPARTCDTLQAFLDEVRAQSGKHVPAGTAAVLVEDATRIRTVLSCR
jgi:hypothetical protein